MAEFSKFVNNRKHPVPVGNTASVNKQLTELDRRLRSPVQLNNLTGLNKADSGRAQRRGQI